MKTLCLLLFWTLMACCGMNASQTTATAAAETKTLVLGGGCFWCLEAAFELVPGVVSVESGYAGGSLENPGYRAVCTGDTGHAEVVRVRYEPSKVSLERLFELFWKVHDPTSLNRQGHDEGTQYRSVIFFADPEQKDAATKAIAEEQKRYTRTIVTEVSPLKVFWVAEDYHQHYFQKNPNEGYCQAVVRPKVEKIRKELGK